MKLKYTSATVLLVLGACTQPPPPAPPTPASKPVVSVTGPDVPTADSVRIAAPMEKAARGSTSAYGAFVLPAEYNEQVREYVELYSRRRKSVFTTWLSRMTRYSDYIEQRLAEMGLPRQLVYVPLIESAYEINTASAMNAAGLWQFMKGTARAEGLEVSAYVDERLDPYRSTDAALNHLARLYRQFDSWYLAFAAYNAGSGRIARLLRERGLPKSDESYWAIADALPKETRIYVPMLMGAAIVGENADAFGLHPDREPPVRFSEVQVPGGTPLSEVAETAGVAVDAVRALNPHLIKGMTPPGRSVRVRIPANGGRAAGGRP